MNRKSKPAAAAAATTTTTTIPPTIPPVCDVCARYASIPGNVTRDGHVYVNRATVAECNADVTADRAANDAARAARAALPADATDAARAAANVAVKRTGDKVWRTRNPHGLGGTVTATRAARIVAIDAAPPVYHAASIAVAERLTAAGVPTSAADVNAAVIAHVAAFVDALNVGAVYAATLTARRDAIINAINAATA